jgi:DNA-binding NarL/FixJ family response regulator
MTLRCVVTDDHPAVRAGLIGLLRSEPGFVVVGAAGSATDALQRVRNETPDLALVDYNLPDCDGLQLCCDLKALPSPPRVVVYSAFAGPQLSVAGIVAGADAVLAKGAPVDEMFELLRAVGRGTLTSPDVQPAVVEGCIGRLEESEIPIFGMAMARTPLPEIAAVTGEKVDAVRLRLRCLVRRLGPQETIA